MSDRNFAPDNADQFPQTGVDDTFTTADRNLADMAGTELDFDKFALVFDGIGDSGIAEQGAALFYRQR